MPKLSNIKTNPAPQVFPNSPSFSTIFESEDTNKYLKRLKKKEPIIIFLGNTKYSTIGARILDQTFPLSLVVTIPDQPLGREKKMTPSPVKNLGQELNIPVLEAEKLTSEVVDQIASFNPDFLVVEDYGLILPASLLEVPTYVPLNIHHSLLPKYRGPSPAPTAILNGEEVSGVTVIKMSSKVDAGEVLDQQTYLLKIDETTDSLLTKLNTLGGQLVIEVIQKYLENKAQVVPQDDAKATFTKFIKKEDGFFDISNPPDPEKLDRMIRAYYPWPNVWTIWKIGSGKRKAERIVKFLPDQMIQMEGKKAVKLRDFLNGYPDFPLKQF